MTAVGYDWSTIQVLWRRDLKRFWRQPTRLIGALGQPIIFWGVIGSGLSATFQLPGAGVGYLEYFYPGVVLMVALFASIFASVSVIEDRHGGFLQAVLAGPGSRFALVIGKSLGSASVALVQIAAFLALAPLAGFDVTRVDWPLLLGALVAASVGLSALGFAAAWWLDNVQAYHAIQMTLLVPLWVVSGAMFPPPADSPAFAWVMGLNPVAYAVAAVRHALYGGLAPSATVLPVSPLEALGVVGAFAAVAVLLATLACRRG
jgi:daunorubicin resistance ABC transporter membrane protein